MTNLAHQARDHRCHRAERELPKRTGPATGIGWNWGKCLLKQTETNTFQATWKLSTHFPSIPVKRLQPSCFWIDVLWEKRCSGFSSVSSLRETPYVRVRQELMHLSTNYWVKMLRIDYDILICKVATISGISSSSSSAFITYKVSL